MTSPLHNRPARGAHEIFQPLEKKFPIIGKIGPDFPTIGKKFPIIGKKTENFFQSLENGRKIFPIVGKLLTPGEGAVAIGCRRLQSVEPMLSCGLTEKGLGR